jgi:hypothetical protein
MQDVSKGAFASHEWNPSQEVTKRHLQTNSSSRAAGMAPNSALLTDACAAALRASCSAAQHGR